MKTLEGIEGLKRGEIIEIKLKPNAMKLIGDHFSYVEDSGDDQEDMPGRSYVGYVLTVNKESLNLAHGWDGNKPADCSGEIKFHLNIIESYSKLK